MSEFFTALGNYEFMRNALLAGLIASVACGVVGGYVVARRITYLAGGIAHCVLGGMGAALYLRKVHGWSWCHPLLGAVFAALLAALVIGWVSLRAREREDTVISAVWAVGMAIGVLFIAQTPGYYEDLMSYLFGNILLVSRGDLYLMLGLDILVVGLSALFYRRFLAVCFDEEFARLRGLHVDVYFILLLCLTALTVVVLVRVVGLILVIALLTLPVATAGFLATRLSRIMVLATLICMALTTTGLAVSYEPEWQPGAITIVLAGGLYFVALVVSRTRQARVKASES